MKKSSKTRIGGGAHRSLSQQASGFTPILGLRKSEILKKKFKAFTLAEVLIPKRVSEIKNKVFNFRGSKIKEPFNLNKKLAAFTLAEVLITLAIIGVVAALTIPSVVAKYQKKQYYTQFMKTYNTLSTAFSLAQAEYGDYSEWNSQDERELIDKFLSPYLKITKICDTYTDCDITDDMDVDNLNTPDAEYSDGYWELFGDNIVVLPDGAFLRFYLSGASMSLGLGTYIYLDTNGIKGPNTWGRDVFELVYIETDDAWKIGTYRMFNSDYVRRSIRSYDEIMKDMLNGDCSTETESTGTECAARLLLEGKMDY